MKASRAFHPLFASALLALLAVPSVPAAEVSASDAARAARAWVDRGYAMGKLPAGRGVAGVREIEDAETGARLLLASFEGGGWVLLSADDLVDPVIAFSEEGDGFDVDDENPFWTLVRGDIAGREAAAGVVRGGAPAPAAGEGEGSSAEPTAAQRKWASLLDDAPAPTSLSTVSDVRVDSFVTTHWGQSSGIGNYYTPYIPSYGGNSVAGCVSIVMSQIMRYYRFPTGSVAPFTRTCSSNGVSVSMTAMAGTYDWDNMPDTYSAANTTAKKQAIGKLVFDCGVSVGMSWKGSAGSASTSSIDNQLKTAYGYAAASETSLPDYTLSSQTSIDKFKSVLIPNCDARAPIGVSVSRVKDDGSRGGHAVIFCGYGYSDGSLVVRVNFGWSGTGDGAWYIPPTLDSSYTYTKVESLIHNIFPTKTGYIASGRVLDVNGDPVEDATVALSDGQTATTDAKGIWAIVAPKGDYTATATKGGVSASRSLSGLGTTSTSSAGNLYDQDIRFTTPLIPSPTVEVRDASNVSFTSATVNYAVTALGSGATKISAVTLEYSVSSDFSGARTASRANQGLGAGAFALSGLSAGTKYYVRVKAENDIGGWSTATGSFTTSSYTAPVFGSPAVAADASAGLPLPVTVRLLALGAGSSWADVEVQAATTADFASVAASATTRFTAATSRSVSLSGLGAGATYYLRAVATGQNGLAATSGSTTVRPVDPTAPAGAFSIGSPARTSLPVTWSMTSLGSGNSSATVYLDYGTSAAFGSTLTVGTFNATKSNQSATISGLEPNTTYSVRLRLVAGTKTFATDPATETTLPVGDPAATVSAGDILSRGATVTVNVTSLGEAATSATVTLEYGKTTSYGSTAAVSPATLTAAGRAAATLSGLDADTTYYIRATVRNNGGKAATATTSFKTDQPNDPVLGTPSATTSYTSASVSVPVTMLGSGATSASGTIRYGTAAGSYTLGSVEIPRFTAPGTVSGTISGLAQNTTYYFEITIVNNLSGQTVKTGSFTTKSVATLAWGEGYYEPGLLQGYKSGNGALTPAGETIASGGYAASLARGPIASYAHMSETFENEVDGATYSWANQRAFVYEGQMWMEGGVAYQFAGLFYPGEYLYVDGEEILVAKDCQNYNAPYGLVVQSCTPASTGWHDVKIVEWSEWNGGGAGGGGTADWNMATKSPFYSIKYGLAWNTNGVTTVTDANVGQWKKLLDSGDRHLFRARGKQAECAFLDQTPTWTKTSLKVPVRIDSLVDGMTLTVYITRNPNAWYFEDRWERSATVAAVPDGASVQSVTFSGIDTTTDWYVSARLSDGSKYDQWTDPVKWTPVIASFEKPTFSVKATDGVEPMSFGGTASSPKVSITINNASADAVYAVYASGTVDGTFARVTSKQTRKGDLLSFEVDAGTGGARFFQIRAAATESDLP